MPLFIALLTFFFARPTVQAARPGPIDQKVGWFYYVASIDGVYRVEKQKAQHTPKNFHPAFLFSSDTRFKISSKSVSHEKVTIVSADASTIQVRYSDGFVVRKGTAQTLTAIHEVDSATAITVGPSNDEYLLIKWQGDSSSCEFGFTLFRFDGPELKEASTNAYKCDL